MLQTVSDISPSDPLIMVSSTTNSLGFVTLNAALSDPLVPSLAAMVDFSGSFDIRKKNVEPPTPDERMNRRDNVAGPGLAKSGLFAE